MQLLLWRNWRKTALIFFLTLMIILDIASNSIISVVSVVGVLIVLISISYCCYIWGMRKLRKSSIMDHPYQRYLETDVSISEEAAARLARLVVIKVNPMLGHLRAFFLIEDLVDSLKFLVVLCGLNVLGDYVNGMTLLLIGFVLLFTLPKVYEWKKPMINNQLKHLQGFKTRLLSTKKKTHSSAPTVTVDPQVISSNRQKTNGIECDTEPLNLAQFISSESDYAWPPQELAGEDYQHYKEP
ncbi:hypothetical protein KR093_010973 [Drosophila rubida]|uniref:Reticulon-like protein n=1 Tax=Drosophila rubida TaxID=30044 RepID=A0AAD4K296_9MUSC|nr:hypothetical protein KR093_010973 [Drosophila rubida]